ncbi:hypothetical protein G6F40_016137 [Rhizopus arrhizus]|nr:hypothetical protein G6F40_016137 [Rhizopus arrhizus]
MRPSFTSAAPPDEAERGFNRFVGICRENHAPGVETGRFGAHMVVSLVNDGPAGPRAGIMLRSLFLPSRWREHYMANERPAQSEIKQLISKGLEQGYLTYAEVNDHLPDDMVDPEQIEDIIGMINGMGIDVHEVAPDPPPR